MSCQSSYPVPMPLFHGFVRHQFQQRTAFIEVIDRLLQILEGLPVFQGPRELTASSGKENAELTLNTNAFQEFKITVKVKSAHKQSGPCHGSSSRFRYNQALLGVSILMRCDRIADNPSAFRQFSVTVR